MTITETLELLRGFDKQVIDPRPSTWGEMVAAIEEQHASDQAEIARLKSQLEQIRLEITVNRHILIPPTEDRILGILNRKD